jgi:hypothetical protein
MLDVYAMRIMRKNLLAFINADPADIQFQRQNNVQTSNGGWKKGTPTTLEPQRCRLVTFKRRLSNFTEQTVAGVIPVMDYTLVCKTNVDIQRDDEFDYHGDHYIVISIEPKMEEDRARTDRVVAQLRIEVKDQGTVT